MLNSARIHTTIASIYGLIRKGGRGLPESLRQEEVTSPKIQETVRGTVHAVKLFGDPDCPSLVAVTVYDTKPVFLNYDNQKNILGGEE